MRFRFASWTVKEHIDVDKLDEAMKSVFDGKNCPHLTKVSGFCAIVVSAGPITQEFADKVWDYFEMDKALRKPSPFDEVVDWD